MKAQATFALGQTKTFLELFVVVESNDCGRKKSSRRQGPWQVDSGR